MEGDKKNTGHKFQKGNQFWRLAKYPGRPPMYTAETLWAKFVEYMEFNSEQGWSKEDYIRSGPGAGEKVYLNTPNPPSIGAFALFCGMTRSGFDEMYRTAKDGKKDPEMEAIIAHVKETIMQLQIDGASANIFNANIVARVTGLAEKKEIDMKTDISDDERKDLIKKILEKTKKDEDDLL